MTTEKTFDSADLWEKDRNHFIHPYTDFSSFKETGSQVMVGGEGVFVTDSEGKRFLDGIAGLWCVNIGHGRQEMADTISRQVMDLEFYNPFGHTSNAPAAELASKLASLAPKSLNHVFYSTGGSTANDVAIRLTHFYFHQRGQHSKKKIISRVDAYHGSTYLAATLTGIHATKDGFDGIGDFIHYVSAANMYRRPAGMNEEEFCDFLVNELENRIQQLGPDNVAAFIAEPIMGAGGVLVAPANYHRRIYEVCKKYDLLYISDEVVTAFGRLGKMMASEPIFGITPDIICLAKGISSGYIPLGATLISDEVYDVISRPQSKGGALTIGFTYSGHSVACAAALKNIEIIEREKLCAHVEDVGSYFYSRMKSLEELAIVGDVRGSHMMIGVELVSNKNTKTGFEPSVGSAMRVFNRCVGRGLIVRPIGDILVLSPPLTITREQCDTIVEVLEISIRETGVELLGKGAMAAE